jgi:uncharacterized membrane protein YbhN (UPF0104 family)
VTIRYVQRSGADLVTATGIYAVGGVAGVIVPMIVIAASAVAAGRSDPIHLKGDELTIVLIAIGVILACIGVALSVKPVRRKLVPSMKQALHNLSVIFREPARAIRLFGNQLGVTLSYVACFVYSCRAFNIHQSTAVLAFVYLAGSTVGNAAPTPGGLGAVEALLTGALIGVGVDSAVAVAAVLTFRLVTFWLPIPFGAWSLANLRKHNRL